MIKGMASANGSAIGRSTTKSPAETATGGTARISPAGSDSAAAPIAAGPRRAAVAPTTRSRAPGAARSRAAGNAMAKLVAIASTTSARQRLPSAAIPDRHDRGERRQDEERADDEHGSDRAP